MLSSHRFACSAVPWTGGKGTHGHLTCTAIHPADPPVIQVPARLQDRLTLGALITLDVHARDVVQQLVDAGVGSTTDFEWVSQLRYYWRNDVWVEMVQASIIYGYEYLGNTPRWALSFTT